MRRVELLRCEGSAKRAALVLARAAQLNVSAAQVLVERLGVVPRAFDEVSADALVNGLVSAGVEARSFEAPPTAQSRCVAHEALESAGSCESCAAAMCVVCLSASPRPLCGACLLKQHRRLAFRNARVGVLVVVMLGVLAWGLGRQLRLDRRVRWQRPLTVSVVLVTTGESSSALTERWSAAAERLTEWFAREWRRYRVDASMKPVQFVLEPIATVSELPAVPEDTRSRLTFERALDAIDASVHVRRNDATVYVVLLAGETRVEGIGEAGGRRGLIFADGTATDLTLESVALAHEVLHFFGATDKYDSAGHAVWPGGLAAPEAQPLFPQPGGEVMVGEVATSQTSGRPIRTLDEARVGPTTATEIRWQ